MSTICIVPARGGSKRIPKKNIKDFLGKPIIAYPLTAAVESRIFDQIVVSTDSDDIAVMVPMWGCHQVVFRPAELADDHVGTQPVMRHALSVLNVQPSDTVCCLYATAAMTTPADLRLGLSALERSQWNPTYAFSVTTFASPVQRALLRDEHGAMSPVWDDQAEKRSQDLEPHWHDAGQWYFGRASAFLRDERIYAPSSLGVPIPRWRVQDIDTEEDWIRAELLAAALALNPKDGRWGT